MAKTEKNNVCDCKSNDCKLTVSSGFQFGFGFFLANLAGILIISLITWVILLIARSFGVII